MDILLFLPGILAAYAILVVGASSPGPSVALLIGIATAQGRAPAMVATLGIASGSMAINLLTMLGVGLILSQAAWAMTTLRFIGAAYLLYLAYGAFKKALDPPLLHAVEAEAKSMRSHFATGFLLQVTNPKAIAFWLSIASIGAVDGANLDVVALFVFGAFAISFICHGAWALAMSTRHIRTAYGKGRRWIEAALGAFFVFAAWRLATSER